MSFPSCQLVEFFRFLGGFSASRYCRLALFVSIYVLMPAASLRFLYYFGRDSVGSKHVCGTLLGRTNHVLQPIYSKAWMSGRGEAHDCSLLAEFAEAYPTDVLGDILNQPPLEDVLQKKSPPSRSVTMVLEVSRTICNLVVRFPARYSSYRGIWPWRSSHCISASTGPCSPSSDNRPAAHGVSGTGTAVLQQSRSPGERYCSAIGCSPSWMTPKTTIFPRLYRIRCCALEIELRG